MNQMRDQLKMNLNYLQIKKINVTVTAEKVDEKKWGYLFSYYVPF